MDEVVSAATFDLYFAKSEWNHPPGEMATAYAASPPGADVPADGLEKVEGVAPRIKQSLVAAELGEMHVPAEYSYEAYVDLHYKLKLVSADGKVGVRPKCFMDSGFPGFVAPAAWNPDARELPKEKNEPKEPKEPKLPDEEGGFWAPAYREKDKKGEAQFWQVGRTFSMSVAFSLRAWAEGSVVPQGAKNEATLYSTRTNLFVYAAPKSPF